MSDQENAVDTQNQEDLDTTDENQPSEAEEKALAGGWRPQEEWEGDPDDWVDFREFNRRGELMDRISDQTRELKALKKQVTAMKDSQDAYKDHQRKVIRKELEGELQQIKEIKKQGLETQDFDVVVEADERIADTKKKIEELEEAPQEETQSPDVHPDLQVWMDENKWYSEKPTLRGAAETLAAGIRDEYPEWSVKQVLDEVTKQMKDEFPEQMGVRRTRASGVTESGNRKQGGGSDRGLVARLSPEQRKIGQTFVASGAMKNLTEYAKDLDSIGELG